MADNRLKRIAIVGASSNLGATTLRHLLEVNPHVAITITTRENSTATFPSSSRVTVKKGSYNDPVFLQSAFQGQDLVMLIINIFGMDVQPKLIDAAAKAGVKWILPNEYGGDNMNPDNPQLHSSLMVPKNEARKQIDELAKTHPGLKWIGVATNPWTEMSLNAGLFGIDVPNRTFTLYSGGGQFNSSSHEQVGRGIAALLSLPVTASNPRACLEHYANNFAYISSFLLTQQSLFESVKRVTNTSDADWTSKHSSIEERIRIAQEKLAAGDFWGGADLIYCYYMGDGLGGNFEAKAKEDREVLGLEEENLDEVVKGALADANVSYRS